jgi:hypothetical protein
MKLQWRNSLLPVRTRRLPAKTCGDAGHAEHRGEMATGRGEVVAKKVVAKADGAPATERVAVQTAI